MRKFTCTALILFLFFFFVKNVEAETLRVPLYSNSKPPITILDGKEVKGIYPDLFREILSGAGVDAVFDVVPNMRRRIGFEEGKYIISCCSNPVWRQRPKEQTIQVFSKPFYVSKDMFFFPFGKEFPIEDLTSLSNKRVGLVYGYHYRGQEFFGERLDFKGELALMEGLARGRVDVAIINQDIVLASTYKTKLVLGPLHDEATLHVRVNRSRLDLLDRINQSIVKMIETGKRDEIVDGYMNNPAS